ncbi:alpha/beta hydrolase [Streptomyces sp. ISL-44]|uniref:alpha/beta fold hydrolase n=1 Tax=Streptomyces sp. ISL-44 TaxID=2819184 RepID=UPI0027E2FBA4|nr:alpha/beta hydrolase [Streptomyces sp. ISL-44]
MPAEPDPLDAPSRIRSLIGISAVPASGFPLEGETWELFAGAAKSPANRRAILDNTSGGLHDDAWLDGMVGRSVGGSSATAFRTYLDSWARVDFHERVKGNPVPVLLLAGANDPALGPEAMRATWMQWYPNAQLEVLPDTGHYPPEESPEAVAEAVERYLGR